MPRSRFDEFVALAEDKDGLVTAGQAVAGGFTDSVLARLAQPKRMYRCIMGRVPPEAPERLSEDNLQPPSRLVKLPGRAVKALMKALAVRPKERCQTIEDFQQGLSIPPAVPAEPPRPKTASDIFDNFLRWWTIGGALMVAGSLLRSNVGFAVLCAGLILAAFSLRDIGRMLKFAAVSGGAVGLLFLFGFVAVFAVVLTGINASGGMLLAPISLSLRRSLQSSVTARLPPPPIKLFCGV